MSPVAFEIFGKPIYWYGIIISLGVLIGIYLAMHYAKKLNYDSEIIIDLSLLAIPFAVIGARIYYVIFKWDEYAQNPIQILHIWEGGLAIFGAVIGGIIAGWIFSKWRKVNFWDLADIAAPSIILGQALGRWGNFFNQEAFGLAIHNPTWQKFPFAVYIDHKTYINEMIFEPGWYMATFFYEFLWNIIVFAFLMYYKKRRKKSGEIFLLYLILYSCGRIVIEGLRLDSLMLGDTVIRVSQLLSGLLILIGTITFIIRRKIYLRDTNTTVEITNGTSDSTFDDSVSQDNLNTSLDNTAMEKENSDHIEG